MNKKTITLGGIYKIENLATGRIYIGKSKNVIDRFKQHKQSLKNGHHVNKNLQKDYNIYGKSNFEFSILKKTDDVKKLYYYESYYVDKYNCNKNGYNIKRLYNHKAIKFIEKDIDVYINKIKCILSAIDSGSYSYNKYITIDKHLRNYLILDNYHIKTLFAVISNGYSDRFQGYTFNILSDDKIEIGYVSEKLINKASSNFFIG